MRDYEHRSLRVEDDRSGHAPEQRRLDPSQPAVTNHDRLGAEILGDLGKAPG